MIGLQAASRPCWVSASPSLTSTTTAGSTCWRPTATSWTARPRIPLTMPLQLLLGHPGGRLTDVSDRAGEPFRQLHLGRGLAVGDLDNDGRLDALVLNQDEPLVYLHNRTEQSGHFIRFSLEGTRSNRDAVGARVTIALWRSPHGVPARRRGQLSIGQRSQAPFRPGGSAAGRIGRGALAVRTDRPPQGITRRSRVSPARGRNGAGGQKRSPSSAQHARSEGQIGSRFHDDVAGTGGGRRAASLLLAGGTNRPLLRIVFLRIDRRDSHRADD